MGITGLIPFLKNSSKPTHVREFKGCTVAIDAYCWLHKGAFACAEKLAKKEKTDMHVKYCMKFVNMLLSHDVKPILVFDGQNLPSKQGTESKRRESRDKFKKQAREHLRMGNSAKARECFQRCVDITSEMALDLMKACRAINVDCIVAPYEADAQLAYLCKQQFAHVIITEDSDLLAFGCERVLLKMDANGNGLLIEKDKLNLSLGNCALNFTHDKFRRMCILSGCDYLSSLPGIGLGKSFKFFSRVMDHDIYTALSRLPVYLNMAQLEVTQEYKDAFVRAELTFLHQLVYDPVQRQMVPLNPYPPGLNPEDLTFAGKYLEPQVAFDLALGNLDTHTLQRIADFHPDRKSKHVLGQSKYPSIWSPNYIPRSFPSQALNITIVEKSAELTLGKHVEVTVNCAVKNKSSSCDSTEETLTTAEISAQYLASRPQVPTSPVLSTKRRRISQDGLNAKISASCRKENFLVECSSSQTKSSSSVEESPALAVSPRSRNPFAKVKSPASPKFTMLKSSTEVKALDSNGSDVIVSSYFETTTPTSQQTMPIDPLSSPVKLNETLCVIKETPEKVLESKFVQLQEKFQFERKVTAGTTPARSSSFTATTARRVLVPVTRRKSASKMTLPQATSSMRQMSLQMFGFKRNSSD